jgi:electron transport complex protein RnfB
LIDAILPQTQCTKCGYAGCRPYAEAIAAGDAINKCPPGGQQGIEQLASLLHVPVIPLDTTQGEEPAYKLVAFIREAECIGCTKCIQACPVDAIIGAAKLMHTIVTDICTGCDLCVAPCPVDCIDMVLAPPAQYSDSAAELVAKQIKADLSRQRFQKRNARLQKLDHEKQLRRQAKKEAQSQHTIPATVTSHNQPTAIHKNSVQEQVQAALAAVKAQTATQPAEDQRAKLERLVASAQERFDRAEAKIVKAEQDDAKQRHYGQSNTEKPLHEPLDKLRARREDMRFKLDDARKKLTELDSSKPSQRFTDAVNRMATLRSQKTDSERLANGLVVIQQKLLEARTQLAQATGDEKIFLEEDIQRLLAKQTDAEKSLAELDNKQDTEE